MNMIRFLAVSPFVVALALGACTEKPAATTSPPPAASTPSSTSAAPATSSPLADLSDGDYVWQTQQGKLAVLTIQNGQPIWFKYDGYETKPSVSGSIMTIGNRATMTGMNVRSNRLTGSISYLGQRYMASFVSVD